MPFSAMLGLAMRSFLVAGEVLATAEWLPDRSGQYATAIQIIDPARLCNPNNLMDTDRLRAGVELDRHGAPVAYHIRQALPGDYWMGMAPYTWKRVPRETAWERRQVLHVFEPERPEQTRGKSGIAAILAKSKTLERFQDVNLEAAIVNAMYAAVIESEFDHAQVAEALGTVKEGSELASAILTAMAEYHSAGTVRFDGVKIPHLYPGEDFVHFVCNFSRNRRARPKNPWLARKKLHTGQHRLQRASRSPVCGVRKPRHPASGRRQAGRSTGQGGDARIRTTPHRQQSRQQFQRKSLCLIKTSTHRSRPPT